MRSSWSKTGYLLGLTLLGTLTCPATAQTEGHFGIREYWDAFLSIEGKLGPDRNIGEVDLLIPLTQFQDQLLFTDFRYRLADDSSQEFNLGLGYRHLITDNIILGGYGFYDHLLSPNDNQFSQLTFGGEVLLEYFEFRGNIYIPEDKESQFGTFTNSGLLIGNTLNFAQSRGVEKPLPGFDLEAGVRSPVKDINAWLYAGYFHFDDSGFETVSGPRIRAEWNIPTDMILPGSTISTGVQWQTDDVRNDITQVTIGFRVPLGFGGRPGAVSAPLPDWQPKRMTRKVERDVDIVTGTTSKIVNTQPATIPGTAGTPFGNVTVVRGDGSPTGTGTQADPTSDLEATINANAPVIFIQAGASGERLEPANTLNLQDDQRLYGGGAVLQLANTDGSQTSFFRVPGSSGFIEQTDNLTNVLVAANDNTIDNVVLIGGNNGLVVNNVNNVFYAGTLSSQSGDGLVISGGSDNILIQSTEVVFQNASSQAAIRVNNASNVSIQNSGIRGHTNEGILIENGASNVSIGNSFTTSTPSGGGAAVTTASSNIRITDAATNNITIENTTLDSFAGDGLVIENNANNITINGLFTSGSGTSTDAFRITDADTINLSNINVQGNPFAGNAAANRIMNAQNVTNLTINTFAASGFVGGTSPTQAGITTGEIFVLDNVNAATLTNIDLAQVNVISIASTPGSFDSLVYINNSQDITFQADTTPGVLGPASFFQTGGHFVGALVRVENSGGTTPITFDSVGFDLSQNLDSAGDPGAGTFFAIDSSTVTIQDSFFQTNADAADTVQTTTFDFVDSNVTINGTGNTFTVLDQDPLTASPTAINTGGTITGSIDFDDPAGTLDAAGFTPTP
ncbi:MAG: inverse autotransporter beta domain-containing protein [Phycisphaeraceae bacterium]